MPARDVVRVRAADRIMARQPVRGAAVARLAADAFRRARRRACRRGSRCTSARFAGRRCRAARRSPRARLAEHAPRAAVRAGGRGFVLPQFELVLPDHRAGRLLAAVAGRSRARGDAGRAGCRRGGAMPARRIALDKARGGACDHRNSEQRTARSPATPACQNASTLARFPNTASARFAPVLPICRRLRRHDPVQAAEKSI